MAILVKIPGLSLYFISSLLLMMSFSLTSFADDIEINDENRVAALASRVVSELDGLQPMHSVYMSYQKDGFYVFGFSVMLQVTHHKVGRVIRLFENGLAEVKWDLKDGLPVSDKETEYLNIKDLKREISEFDEFYSGKTVNFYSDYGRKPFTFEGTVKRVFAGGQIEVEWNAKNQKQKQNQLGINYWSASQLRPKENGSLGTILPDQSKVLMALTSAERGSKKVVPDYSNMLEQIVLSRGDAICRISGFEGLASHPRVEPLDHHWRLQAYLPIGESLVEDDFYRTRAWNWSHMKDASNTAVVSIMAGSIGAVAVGLAAAPFTGGISAVVGVGVFYSTVLGGLGVMSTGGIQGHLSYPRVLERNENGKIVHLDFNSYGKKISPLVFKEIRCAVTSEDRLKFDTSWIFKDSKTKAVEIREADPVQIAQDANLIDFDTVL